MQFFTLGNSVKIPAVAGQSDHSKRHKGRCILRIPSY